MTAPGYRIRVLTATDIGILRSLRLDALRLHPLAYRSTFEEESQVPLEDLTRRLLLPPATMFGAFAGDTLAGMAGLRVETRAKVRHIGHLFSVYVAAAHRGSGLGRALAEAAIAHARAVGLRVIELIVTVGNDPARRIYADLGFRTYGIERRGLYLDGAFHDFELMALDLD